MNTTVVFQILNEKCNLFAEDLEKYQNGVEYSGPSCATSPARRYRDSGETIPSFR